MSYIHLVNGDVAADTLSAVLAAAHNADPVMAMRDDLAAGPLRSVDDDYISRAAFWKRALGDTERNVTGEFEHAAMQLDELVAADTPVVVWHGQSASDQLMLRRVAYQLRNAPQRINEIALSLQELNTTPPWGDRPASLARYPAAALSARIKTIAPVSILRISRLALEWQELKHMNSDLRHWRGNSFEGGSFAEIDAIILEHATPSWQPSARLIANIMDDTPAVHANDVLIFWRCRELAATGRLSLRGDAMHMRASEARIGAPA
jgi:hypothetical protein